jgi:ABC-type nitrate/sulfonate/bicarbonate transport system ATPase subunit
MVNCCFLRIRNLSKTFSGASGQVRAVRDFSLDIPSSDFSVIVGPSGCGKTTLLKLIAGLEKPDAGGVFFDGDGDGESSGESSGTGGKKARFGFMFQDARLLPWLNVRENLGLAFRSSQRSRAREDIETALELVGLAGWGAAYPRQLSGGMAQRAALARALCRKPQALLLDEPFGALDAFTRTRLRRELDGIWKNLGVTVILVTHDIEEAVELADRVLLMREGALRRELFVDLARPRQRRGREFQEYCAEIEKGTGNA